MEISYLLARLFGIVLIVLFGAMLINQKFYHRLFQDIAKHPVALILSGFIQLICGLLVINVHNIWTFSWQGLITLLGWILFISGIGRLVIPEILLKNARKFIEKKAFNTPTFNILAWVMVVIGIYLSYMGFIH